MTLLGFEPLHVPHHFQPETSFGLPGSIPAQSDEISLGSLIWIYGKLDLKKQTASITRICSVPTVGKSSLLRKTRKDLHFDCGLSVVFYKSLFSCNL